MKLHRIYGLNLRYYYYFKHSYDRISDAFYWPLLDLILWGITSSYLRSFIPNASTIVVAIISGLLLWIIPWRAQYEITVNLLQEFWDNNLVNIFVSPVTFAEWVISLLIIGILKSITSLSFAIIIAFLLYKVQLLSLSWNLVPFIFLLFMSGWWIGFLVAALILRYGTKVQTFAWTMPWVFSPFSAIFYPVSILPIWAQKISLFIPMSYVFEGMREVINTGNLDGEKLVIALILNSVYLLISFLFLYASFKRVINRGLVNTY